MQQKGDKQEGDHLIKSVASIQNLCCYRNKSFWLRMLGGVYWHTDIKNFRSFYWKILIITENQLQLLPFHYVHYMYVGMNKWVSEWWWVSERVSDWVMVGEWVSKWVSEWWWLSERVSDGGRVSEWESEWWWVSDGEWVSECVSEWMSKQMSEWRGLFAFSFCLLSTVISFSVIKQTIYNIFCKCHTTLKVWNVHLILSWLPHGREEVLE